MSQRGSTSRGDQRRDAVQSGDVNRVRAYLKTKPPTEDIDYLLLLQEVPSAPEDSQTHLRSAIFDHLEQQACGLLETVPNGAVLASRPGDQSITPLSPTHDEEQSQLLVTIRGVFEATISEAKSKQSDEDDTFEAIAEALLSRFTLHLVQSPEILQTIVKYGLASILKKTFEKMVDLETDKLLTSAEKAEIIRSTDEDGRTALTLATRECDLDCARILIHMDKENHLLFMKAGMAGDTPLHTAVQKASVKSPKDEHQKTLQKNALSIVKEIVNHRPNTLYARNKKGEPPYSYVKNLGLGITEVTVFLKESIFSKLPNVQQVSRALYALEEQSKELGLNLSDFNRISHDFPKFVEDLCETSALINPTGLRNDLFFEDTLLYLCLPDLNLIPQNSVPDYSLHQAVEDFFSWLFNKGVRFIIELTVPDSRTRPLSEDFFREKVLDRFIIDKLNWRRLNVNLDILTRPRDVPDPNHPPAPQFSSLTLYSSGNWSMLYHWISKDGVGRFYQFDDDQQSTESNGARKSPKDVTICIVEPPTFGDQKERHRHHDRMKDYQARMETSFAETFPENLRLRVIPDKKWDLTIPQKIDDDDVVPLASTKLFDDFQDCHNVLKQVRSSGKIHNLNASAMLQHPVKVAIIDNGVDRNRPDFYNKIEKGVSFVTTSEAGSILPYWAVADSHGTQMGSLILKVSPLCRLYIARVCRLRDKIKPNIVAKAVIWATRQKVDIISMSFTMKKKTKSLSRAIQEAEKNSILMFCSTSDEGATTDGNIWPADYPSTITVAASDPYGNRRPESRKRVDILADGQNIMAEGPRYIHNDSNQSVSGSSVATALTSGMAALTLCFARVSNSKADQWNNFRRKDMMMKVFGEMREGSKAALRPVKLFGCDKQAMSDVLKWMERFKYQTYEKMSAEEDEEEGIVDDSEDS